MLTEIDNSLGGIPSNYLTGASRDFDIFEGYIFALLLEEADNVGADVLLTDNGGNTPPTTCTFRTGPSSITSSDPYTYAVITFPGRRKPTLEAHIGVYIAGKSKVRHECDIALIYQTEVEACRQYHRSTSKIALPRSFKVILAIECKYYDQDLDISLARSFIGLVADCEVDKAFFVTNKASSSPAKLLTKQANQGKRLSWQPRIYPNPLDDNDVNRIRGLFKDVFNLYLDGQ